MTNAEIHIAYLSKKSKFTVMVLKVKDVYEYYVRDDKDLFTFDFIFGCYDISDDLIATAIHYFIDLHKDEL